MKIIRLLLVVGLVLLLAALSMAQMNSNTPQQNQQMSPQQGQQAVPGTCPANVSQLPQSRDLRAMAQVGPVLRRGIPSADVFVGGRFAMRVVSSAAGLTPIRRARIIADRLNSAFAAGYTWNQIRVDRSGRYWTIGLGDRSIATADPRTASAMGISTNVLASRWAHQTVVALGGQPSMVAAQIQPTGPRVAVAGSRQQLGQPTTWQNSPTKSVPVINVEANTSVGSAMVAGSQNRLNNVSSVAMYEWTNEGMMVRVFVPITATSTTGVLTRVNGVGVVGLPSEIAPTAAAVPAGTDMSGTISRMSTRWNAAISSRLSDQRQQSSANTKVVPLYAPDGQTIIGAAQISGDRVGIQSVRAMTLGENNGLTAVPVQSSTMTPEMQTAVLNSVVVSAIITPCGPGTAPAATQPETTQP